MILYRTLQSFFKAAGGVKKGGGGDWVKISATMVGRRQKSKKKWLKRPKEHPPPKTKISKQA